MKTIIKNGTIANAYETYKADILIEDERITNIGNEYVDSEEWYPRKMLRDMYARQGYRNMENEEYRKGELYITKIIDEEMKKDDLRI